MQGGESACLHLHSHPRSGSGHPPSGNFIYLSHFTHKETEAQRVVLTHPRSYSEYQNPGLLVSWPQRLPRAAPATAWSPAFPKYLDVLRHHADIPAGSQEAVDGAGQVDPEALTEEVGPRVGRSTGQDVGFGQVLHHLGWG